MSWQILIGDALTVLRTLPSGSAQTCITSPPYWGLCDYGIELNPKYADMARDRIRADAPLLNTATEASV